jgi:hypothetical protein
VMVDWCPDVLGLHAYYTSRRMDGGARTSQEGAAIGCSRTPETSTPGPSVRRTRSPATAA